MPWFVTLFGRDSLITAWQMLAYHPGIAEQTLRLLAHYQGTREDDWRDEQPGKILHELRVGEMANIDAISHTPFTGRWMPRRCFSCFWRSMRPGRAL